jgi:predicted dehydrogenase
MTIRWGVAGTGAIATGFASDLALVDDADLVAVASRSRLRAQEFADRFGVRRAGSYEDLASNPDVDVVYVATPASRHESDVCMFLEAGKHVLCEKPFAVNAAQARRMVDTANRHGSFLMEAMWTRFLPPYRLLASLLADDVIGRPALVESDFGFAVPQEPAHRLWDPSLAGGSLLDLGVYPLQLASFVLGPPQRVVASGVLAPAGVDEVVAAITTHADDTVAVSKSSITTGLACTARIAGARGVIELPGFMHCPRSVTVVGLDGRKVHDTPWPGGGLQFEVVEVHRCLAAGSRQSPVMPHAETLSLMDTLDAVRSQIGLVFPGEHDPRTASATNTAPGAEASVSHPGPGGSPT